MSGMRMGIFFLLILAGIESLRAESGSAEGWTEDIQFFRSNIFEADKSFSEEQRTSAETLLSHLESTLANKSDAEIELALAEIMALTNNGHSFLLPGVWTHRYKQLPVEFRVFSDGVYIIHADPAHEHLVGDRVIAIGDHKIQDVLDTWARFQGGLNGWRNEFLPYFLETPEMLFAAGVSANIDSVQLTIEGAGSEPEVVTLVVRDESKPLEGMDQYIVPSRLLVQANRNPGEGLPLYQQSPGQAFRMEILDNPKTAYIQFKANVDFTGNQDIDAFLDSVFGKLRSEPPQYIILDQRFNFGGDLNITRELMQTLPEFLAMDGKIYVITSGRTFSAGISSVGYLKQVAGDQAVLVGEPVGDDLEFWAEGDLQVLPNSGVAFLMATERHNYQTGCPEDDCHGSIQRHPIRVESLQPEIPAFLTYSDFAAGVDRAMEAIQADIVKQRE